MLWRLSIVKSEEIGISPLWPLSRKKCAQPVQLHFGVNLQESSKQREVKIPFHFLLSMSFNSEQEKKAGIIVSSSYERELFLISSFLEACKYDSLF